MSAARAALGLMALGVLVVVGGLFWSTMWDPSPDAGASGPHGPAMVDVAVPALSGQSELGRIGFEANCASCHGVNAAGQDGVAPPLVHRIYEPGHHADISFHLAVKNGVRAHHWRFGNMPPLDGVSEEEVTQIVAYIRALQKENGIF